MWRHCCCPHKKQNLKFFTYRESSCKQHSSCAPALWTSCWGRPNAEHTFRWQVNAKLITWLLPNTILYPYRMIWKSTPETSGEWFSSQEHSRKFQNTRKNKSKDCAGSGFRTVDRQHNRLALNHYANRNVENCVGTVLLTEALFFWACPIKKKSVECRSFQGRGGWSTWRRVHVETVHIFHILNFAALPLTYNARCVHVYNPDTTFLEELGSSANHPPTHNASFCGALISGKSNFSKSQMTLTICP